MLGSVYKYLSQCNGNSRCCPAASIFGLLIIGINNCIAPGHCLTHTTSPLFHFSQFYSLVQSVVEFEISRKFRRMKVIFTIKILQPTVNSCWLREKWRIGGEGGFISSLVSCQPHTNNGNNAWWNNIYIHNCPSKSPARLTGVKLHDVKNEQKARLGYTEWMYASFRVGYHQK